MSGTGTSVPILPSTSLVVKVEGEEIKVEKEDARFLSTITPPKRRARRRVHNTVGQPYIKPPTEMKRGLFVVSLSPTKRKPDRQIILKDVGGIYLRVYLSEENYYKLRANLAGNFEKHSILGSSLGHHALLKFAMSIGKDIAPYVSTVHHSSISRKKG